MNTFGYDFFHNTDYTVFTFEDSGKNGTFNSAIVYTKMKENINFYNLSLIVKNPNNEKWEDSYYTNNNNAIQIFRTVAATLNLFYSIHPKAKVIFTGSDENRTRIYSKIIKSRYDQILKSYEIWASIDSEIDFILFNPDDAEKYKKFIILNKLNII